MVSPAEVKARIPHTWPLFFARHGHFTPIQQQAILPILGGQDTLLVAATATGKTEAVIAPLLERYWERSNQPDQYGQALLYICPTRALVRDLYERLSSPLAGTGITIGMKTGDTGPLDDKRPFSILLTTPESTDSLLTRVPRLFTNLHAVILDEIHLFDNTPRGDHTRCLLQRIKRIRQYAQSDASPIQHIALSATIYDLEGVARRYLHQGTIVSASGGREIVAEIAPLYDLDELVAALAQRAVQKSLVFCNSRDEVEQTAVYLRQRLPHYAQVFVHYGNLDATVRRDVETRFAEASVAICVSTSTLELGVDIGSVDDVVLLGAPHNLTSFLQRIGRGGRRTAQSRVLCMPKSPREWARFEALLTLANTPQHVPEDQEGVSPVDRSLAPFEDVLVYGFRPSVLVQQIFSLIKQSPTGSIRLADVRRIAPLEVASDEIRQIISQLIFARYLQAGRLGEWKPDEELQELIDRHEFYSNIGADPLALTAVDAFSGRVIAQTDRLYKKGSVVLFGGKAMEVVWQDKYRFGLAPTSFSDSGEILSFQKISAAIPFVVTQTVARSLDIQPGQMVALPDEQGTWLFHFWGTVWGRLLAALLSANGYITDFSNEYGIFVQPSLAHLPDWDDTIAQRIIKRAAVPLAGRLEMGRFHKLLPRNVANSAVLNLLNLETFQQKYREATLVEMPGIEEQLTSLTH
ncbi:MAG: DEAD/DEAH box helicase, partial [Anaerolineaceae bacterium]